MQSCSPKFQVDSTLTGEESMILRALAAGKSDKEVRKSLRISASVFLRVLREIRLKTGTINKSELLSWATCQMQRGDRRIGR
jgi:DNA-binding CsgD family transcriptional regulator